MNAVVRQSDPDDLIDQYIEPHPHRIGIAEVRLAHYGYSVWIVADALNAANGDVHHVSQDFEIPEEAVEAVALYYDRYRKAIDAKILLNALEFNAPI